MRQAPKRLRCAIYTRKSSEEGLEQPFNSLDAQREACLAYVQSQRHEGWQALTAPYDDGGYSGGSMERPALQTLLTDIGAGKVDVVVVYKVDRLTRSLADFAKMVELFDAQQVSFVSVTQQFNTTTSMGRLTLNVLLSFAQFEREVTGERIRDKIAASKKKGMWMGGHVPLGYDLQGRDLVPNESEKEIVRRIFRRYLELGCVRKLQTELKARKVLSKERVSREGRRSGGVPYSRGALYSILQNTLYIGEIAHRGMRHAGKHAAIIDRPLWDRVQALLAANGHARRNGAHAQAPSLLAGLLFDAKGARFTPLHSTKGGKRYRYYTSQSVIRNGAGSTEGLTRMPAHQVEALVCGRLKVFLAATRELLDATRATKESAATQQRVLRGAKAMIHVLEKGASSEVKEFLRAIVKQITVQDAKVELQVSSARLRARLLGEDRRLALPPDSVDRTDAASEGDLVLTAAAKFKRLGGEVRMLVPPQTLNDARASPNEVLVRAIARARRWYEMLARGEVPSLAALAKAAGLHERYVGRVMRIAFLAPDIVEAIIDGKEPASLTLHRLMRGVPPGWTEQRAQLLHAGY